MAKVTVQAQVSTELKEQAEALFAELGISTAGAIRMFLHQVVNTGGLPFQMPTKLPNAETKNVMPDA